MQLLIIDAANVVGSRPNGWWRDRAGAARALHDQLCAAELLEDDIVLVLEGAARSGQPEGRQGRVRTVHASGAGDDAIVDTVLQQMDTGEGRCVTVVTADRALRGRVEASGAATVGPSWLLERLPSDGRATRRCHKPSPGGVM